MSEFFSLKLQDGEDVIAGIHNFIEEKNLQVAVPVLAHGKIKDFELLTAGRNTTLFKDYSGHGYEVNAISGKIHKDKNSYYTNISVILNKSYSTTAHGLLRKAVVDELLELKIRNLNVRSIIEA